jgi:hypothetical protein
LSGFTSSPIPDFVRYSWSVCRLESVCRPFRNRQKEFKCLDVFADGYQEVSRTKIAAMKKDVSYQTGVLTALVIYGEHFNGDPENPRSTKFPDM